MRRLIVLLASIMLASSAYCQTVSSPQAVIERMINTGDYEGHDDKVVGPMGDAAAVVVTKVLAGKNLSTRQIDSVLLILTSAFADPGAVAVESDRQPRTASLILRYLDLSTQDRQLKDRIMQTRRTIEERYAKSIKEAPKLSQ
jgi:hypothetical protein